MARRCPKRFRQRARAALRDDAPNVRLAAAILLARGGGCVRRGCDQGRRRAQGACGLVGRRASRDRAVRGAFDQATPRPALARRAFGFFGLFRDPLAPGMHVAFWRASWVIYAKTAIYGSLAFITRRAYDRGGCRRPGALVRGTPDPTRYDCRAGRSRNLGRSLGRARSRPATLILLSLQLRFYRALRRIRSLDERMQALQRQGRIGFYGACTGQEAVPVALGFALQHSDWVFPALRESSVLLVRGFSLVSYLAQVFGNDRDLLKGRQMPSHMSGRSANVCLGRAEHRYPVDARRGRRVGSEATAQSMVSVACLGDGATSSADFSLGVELGASVSCVPCVFVCQNNQWAISTPAARQSNTRTFAERAPGLRAARRARGRQ